MTILQEAAKDRRMVLIREERETGVFQGVEANLATGRQIQFLKKQGVSAPEGLTKEDASKLVDEELAKESEKDSSSRTLENIVVPWSGSPWQ